MLFQNSSQNINDVILLDYMKPEIWLEISTRNIYSASKKTNGTVYLKCKQKRCNGTGKITDRKMVHIQTHSTHECSDLELLWKYQMSFLLQIYTFENRQKQPKTIYEEVMTDFPHMTQAKDLRSKSLTSIRKWKNTKPIREYPKYDVIKNVIKEELQNLPFVKCAVCLSHIADFIVIPCNHICLCNNCKPKVEQSNSCPICQTEANSIQKVYFSH